MALSSGNFTGVFVPVTRHISGICFKIIFILYRKFPSSGDAIPYLIPVTVRLPSFLTYTVLGKLSIFALTLRLFFSHEQVVR
jgi:hypothetical protein